MRYSTDHSDQIHQRMLEAAGREFRAHGYTGVGVDALAKSANVTSGAVYSHFGSKAGAFRAVVVSGIERLRMGVAHFQRKYGTKWFDAFAKFYLSPEHRRDTAGGCALPSLSAEVRHAEDATRADFEVELLGVAQLIADGLPGNARREAAWPLLAQLAGGVLLARAVNDEKLAREIANAVLKSVRLQAESDSVSRSAKGRPARA